MSEREHKSAFRTAAKIALEPWMMGADAVEVMYDLALRAEVSPEAVEAAMGRRLSREHEAVARGPVAIVKIHGPIFRRADLFSAMSGATSIDSISRDLHGALADPTIKGILLDVDSPGGEVNGTGELAGMIREAAAKKPVWAYVGGLGASGAYYLAAAAQRVVVDASAILGSVGVVWLWRPSVRGEEVEVVSSQSPNKRPDARTPEGRQVLQDTVDALADVFISNVAAFRGMEREAVVERFGNGGLMVGAAAVSAGAADVVGSFEGAIADLTATVEPARAGGGARMEPKAGVQAEGAAAAVVERTASDPGATGLLISEAEHRATASRLSNLEEELKTLRTQNAALLEGQARQELGVRLAAARFGADDDRRCLAPAARVALVAALLPVALDQREAVIAAIEGIELLPVGVVAEGAAKAAADGEADVELNAADLKVCEAEARRKRIPLDEQVAAFKAVRRKELAK